MKQMQKSRKIGINKKHEAGFTVVELMISSAIFALVLLLCAFAVLHVGRMFYKGIITNRTQDIARKLSTDVHQNIIFGESGEPAQFHEQGTNSFAGVQVYSHCFGPVRYSYTLTHSLGSGTGKSAHVLWKDRNEMPGCPPVNITVPNPTDPISGNPSLGEEIVGQNMRVPIFTVYNTGTIWTAIIRVAYADTVDLFEGNNPVNPCLGTIAGGQFCAVSDFTMNARKRL